MKHLSGRKMPIKFRMIENILTMKLDGGQLPEHGRKSAQSTDALVNTNRKLTITGPVLLVKMEAALTQATELSETIESLGSGESSYFLFENRMLSAFMWSFHFAKPVYSQSKSDWSPYVHAWYANSYS